MGFFIWGFICRWADAADIFAGRGGMGAGDVKLSFVLGVWLGFKASIVCLMLAFVFGGIIGVMLLASGIKQRKDPIPFGPFLCIGA